MLCLYQHSGCTRPCHKSRYDGISNTTTGVQEAVAVQSTVTASQWALTILQHNSTWCTMSQCPMLTMLCNYMLETVHVYQVVSDKSCPFMHLYTTT